MAETKRTITIYINGKEVENSIKGINTEMAKAQAEIKKMTIGTIEYENKAKYIAQLKSMYMQHQQHLKELTDTWVNAGKTVPTTMEKIGLSFKQAFSAFTIGGLVSQGITAIISGLKEMWSGSIQAAEESEKSNKLLNSVLKGREDEYRRLITFAENLQLVTGVDDETIKSQEKFLVLQGRSEEQIKKMIQTALDMAAAVPDMSFETALKQLDGTMEGTIGKMGKLDDRLKILTPAELAAGKAVDILGEKYKGTAVNAATLSDKLKVAGEELKEALGDSEVFTDFRKAWLDITQSVTDFIKVPVSEKMEEEKAHVNILTMTLGDHNTALAIKKKTYDELIKIAPSVVEGIDLENISYTKLNNNLKLYNEQAVAKIAMQANEEKLTKVNTKAADELTGLYETQNELLKETFVTRDKLYKQGKDDKVRPLYEQYVTGKTTLLEYAKSLESLVTGYDMLNVAIINNETQQSIYTKSQTDANKAAEETLKIRNDLIKQFGLTKAEELLSGGGAPTLPPDPPDPPKNLEKLKDAYEKLNEKISEYEKLQSVLLVEGKTDEAAWYGIKIQLLKKEKKGYDDLAVVMNDYPTKLESIKTAQGELVKNDYNYTDEYLNGIALKNKADADRLKDTLVNTKKEYEAKHAVLKAELDSWDIIGTLSAQQLAEKQKVIDAINELDDNFSKSNAKNIEEIEKSFQALGNAAKNYVDYKNQKDDAYLKHFENDIKTQENLLKEQYDKGLITKDQYDKKELALENKLTKEQNKIQAEATKRNAEIALIQQAIDTAVAIVAAIKLAFTKGSNVYEAIASSIIAVAEVIALVASASKYNDAAKSIPEYEDGGYTNGDKIYRAGEKGKTEYIAPGWQVNDPVTGPVIEDLNRMRTGRRPRYISDSPAMPVFNEISATNSNYRSANAVNSTKQSYDLSGFVNEFKTYANEFKEYKNFMKDPKNRRAKLVRDELTRFDDEDTILKSLAEIK